LAEIRKKLGIQARQTFATLPPSQYTRDDVRDWDFGDLPERVEVHRNGMTLSGFPTLVDATGGVALRMLDTAEAAGRAMPAGVRRLYLLRSHGELKYLAATMPSIESICLHYAPLGPCDELKKDVMLAVADRVFVANQPIVRTRADFVRRLDGAYAKMSAASNEIGKTLAQSLAIFNALTVALARPYPPLMHPAVIDMRQQMNGLIFKGFIARTPAIWFAHLPRFLSGIQARLSKLTNAGLARDNAGSAQVAPLWKQYLSRARRTPPGEPVDAELETYRWMLEEFRVSIFAQELKTSIPISAKRLEAQWAKVAARP
jgi:ATP-dependent helicase HrpA